jgi:hypothetical protein
MHCVLGRFIQAHSTSTCRAPTAAHHGPVVSATGAPGGPNHLERHCTGQQQGSWSWHAQQGAMVATGPTAATTLTCVCLLLQQGGVGKTLMCLPLCWCVCAAYHLLTCMSRRQEV